MTVRAYVGLGANLGDARATLAQALQGIGATAGVRLEAVSSVWRTAPVDAIGPDFFNAVAAVETRLDAIDLLHALQALELAHGRERPYRNAPRTLDLDLLLYGDDSIDRVELTVPHPRLHQRAFVLAPLLEIAPDITHPRLGRLADHLPAVAGQAIERLP